MKHQHTLQTKDEVVYADLSYPMISQVPSYHSLESYHTSLFSQDDFPSREPENPRKQDSVHIIDIDNQGIT